MKDIPLIATFTALVMGAATIVILWQHQRMSGTVVSVLGRSGTARAAAQAAQPAPALYTATGFVPPRANAYYVERTLTSDLSPAIGYPLTETFKTTGAGSPVLQ